MITVNCLQQLQLIFHFYDQVGGNSAIICRIDGMGGESMIAVR